MKALIFKLILIVCLIITTYKTQSASPDYITGALQFSAKMPELADSKAQKNFAEVLDADELITFVAFVPEIDKSEVNTKNKPGVLVYISPTSTGKIPKKWISLMQKHNLIWISANHSGNNIDPL